MNLSRLVRQYVDLCDQMGPVDDIRFLKLKAMYAQYGVELTDDMISEEICHRLYQNERSVNHDAIAHKEDLTRE